jgi:hypothetical protein
MVRNDRPVFKLSLSATLCLAATQVIFWMFTYPINVASNNWTVAPEAFGRRAGSGNIHTLLMPY